MPKYLPVGLTQYVPNIFSKKSPPYHVTQDDVSTPLRRLEMEQTPTISRSGGEVASSPCYTRRTGRDSLNLPGSRKLTSTPPAPTLCVVGPARRTSQHRQTTRLYRRMRIGAVQRELSRNNGERFLAPGCACVTRADWLRRNHDTALPKGAHF